MRYILIILLLSSCSANWHIQKAMRKGALIKTDTVFQQIITERTITDTVVVFKEKIFSDTITIETLRWKSKTKIDTLTKTIYQQVECKPDTIRVPVAINTEVDCPPRKRGWILFLVGFALGISLILFLKFYLR